MIRTIATMMNEANSTPLAENNKFLLMKIKNKTKLGIAHKLMICVRIFRLKKYRKKSGSPYSGYFTNQKIIIVIMGNNKPEIKPQYRELIIFLLMIIMNH